MARPRGWRISRSALHDRLEDLRITQAELAARADISVQMLSDLASPAKRAGASPRTAAALAEAARCRLGTLFPESEGFGPLSPQRDVA